MSTILTQLDTDLYYNGSKVTGQSGITVPATGDHEGVFGFNGSDSDDNRPLFAEFTDNGNKRSASVLIRAKRCLDRYSSAFPSPSTATIRANGPAGWVGLECVNGRMHISWDLVNTDSSYQRMMSIDISSAVSGNPNPVRIAEADNNNRVGALQSWSGSVPFPYDSDTVYEPGYDGNLLIRGWHRFSTGEFEATSGTLGTDKDILHSRTYFAEMPSCGDTENPSTPTGLRTSIDPNGDLRLTWQNSTDNVGVVEYQLYRNNVEMFTTGGSPAVTDNPGTGTGWWQVRARDADGNESFKTPPVPVDPADTQNPSTPTNLAADLDGNDTLTLTWTNSTDNIAVLYYEVIKTGNVEFTVGGSPAVIPNLPSGDSWWQVRAVDTAGNNSYKTVPVLVSN